MLIVSFLICPEHLLAVFHYIFSVYGAYFAIFAQEAFIIAIIMIAIKANEAVLEVVQDEIII